MRVHVDQDGADFYVYANADKRGAGVTRHCALFLVGVETWPGEMLDDYDLQGAKLAREWFVERCKRNGIKPDFGD